MLNDFPAPTSPRPGFRETIFPLSGATPTHSGGAANIILRERLVAGTALGPLDKRHFALASNRAARAVHARTKKHPRRVISRQSFCMLLSTLQVHFLTRCGPSPCSKHQIVQPYHRLSRWARSLPQVPRLGGGKFPTRQDALETFFSSALLAPRQRCCQNSPARF